MNDFWIIYKLVQKSMRTMGFGFPHVLQFHSPNDLYPTIVLLILNPPLPFDDVFHVKNEFLWRHNHISARFSGSDRHFLQ